MPPLPVVAVDRSPANFRADLVTVDNVEGTRRGVEHLFGLGHREVALLGGPLRHSTAKERERGYHEAVRAAGNRPPLAVRSPAVRSDAPRATIAGATAVTPRAAEVVRLIARGKAMKQVAADLGISVRTVAFHKYRTMRNLGLDSSAALVRYAVHNEML